MGIRNDVIIQNKINLEKLGEFLNYLLNNSPNKSQNNIILKDIGLIKEYNQIIIEKEPNLLIYYSKNHKIIKNIQFLTKMRENFLEWVKYLFDIIKEDIDSIQKSNNKIEQIKTMNLTKEYFQNNIKKYLFNNKSFNKIINYGIPPNLRIFIWEIIISEKYNEHKTFNYEQELKEYRILLSKNKPNPQIEKDIHRTFIKEEEQTPNRIQILKNELNCINNYHNSGYCQGMNYIIGFLLKITNYNEIMSFYFFRLILKDIEGYFEEGLPLLHKNIKIFENYFCEFYPKIFQHFKKHEIINEFYITKWLQTLLTLTLPLEELSIIWDVLLFRGFDFIIFICLAIFAFIEDNILKLKESADIVHYLEKALNPEGESLIPINIHFFEQIDEYIIPLNDIIEKAEEIEKKANNMNNRIILGKNIYKSRKSDNQLLEKKFLSLKENNKINIETNNNNKYNSYQSNNKNNTQLNNKPIQISNFPVNNNTNNNINQQQSKNLAFDKKKIERHNYYSTKNVGTYNFKIQNEINPFLLNNQINNNLGFLRNNSNLIYSNNYNNKFFTYNPY